MNRPRVSITSLGLAFLLVACGSGEDTSSSPGSGGSDVGTGGATGNTTGGSAMESVAAGGSATGGIATGGSATGGIATGGSATGGTATGGSTTGGGVGTGGSATGGVATGGSATGGSAAGGDAAGGDAAGGDAAGGDAAGGDAAGGDAAGGDAAGGDAAGGDAAGGMPTAGTSAAGTGTGGETQDVACDPADQTPDPTPVTSWTESGDPPTGPYDVTIETHPSLPTQTIYRPDVNDEIKMPIVVWGEGGCMANGLIMAEFVYDLATHGFLMIADGTPDGSGSQSATGEIFEASITWAIDENERPCSPLYQKLDTTKIAAMGQSCGGLMTMLAAGDPRLTTIVLWNSGLMSPDQAVYDSIHTPMAIFNGGPDDIAYENGARDYAEISPTATFPIFHGNNTFGHGGTYNDDNGGVLSPVGVAWLRWQLMGDEGATGQQMFWGSDCGLCTDSGWTVEKVNMGD